MFGLFKKKAWLTDAENQFIVAAIQEAEKQTSGEVRVYVESKNPLVSTLERAHEIFVQLNMHETALKNGVLIYVAVKHREVAIFGDEGIHLRVGTDYWNRQIDEMLIHFRKNEWATGIKNSVETIGQILSKQFPYQPGIDKNELPDEIIFGN